MPSLRELWRTFGPGARTYRQALTERRLARRVVYPISPSAGKFALLTGVYERTPVPFFHAAAQSVRAQEGGELEWVIVAHGPISSEMAQVLTALERDDARIRIQRRPSDLGIIGAMRQCLETSRAEFVIPLDADDVLEPDALRVINTVACANPEARLLYADEDQLRANRPCDPYRRPAWDPVLNLESSYIWHPVALHRATALELGVYTDQASNYCHDWDTVFRFARAGHTPLHIPEVLYHWRTHAASHTNRADPDTGSLASQRHLLESELTRRARPELYKLELSKRRGAAEWWMRRAPRDPDPLAVVCIGGREITVSGAKQTVTVKSPACLVRAVAFLGDPLCLVVHESVGTVDHDAAWEAMRLFDFHDDVAIVAGCVLNRGADLAPGAYVMGLKARTVSTLDARLFAARTRVLARWLGGRDVSSLAEIESVVVAASRADGARIATSPLMSGRLG